jgi:hypothetical protein
MKIKVYAVSVAAFAPFSDKSTPGINTYVEHLPALIPADSIEEAAENIKAFALERWKLSEGWSGHQAAITSVTTAFFDAALNALEAGQIDEDSAIVEERAFQFIPNANDVLNRDEDFAGDEISH